VVLDRLERDPRASRGGTSGPTLGLVARSPAMGALVELARRVAKVDSTVLITGESGTGKEVIADLIHAMSPRSKGKIIKINCAALPRELIESELFGSVKGAFTGAHTDREGLFRQAEGGTLFLDEIGDLPMEIQPKLLRLLQEREYERLGENTTRQANVRIIAATNRDLKKRVAEGTFREDLFFRLNVIVVEMPPLRKLESDVVRFAEHYAQYFAEQCVRKLE